MDNRKASISNLKGKFFVFYRQLLIGSSIFCVLWIIGITSVFITDYDELLAFLERYASPDGTIDYPKSSIFLILVGPGFIPLVFFTTFRKWAFPLKYLPWYCLFFVLYFMFFIYYQNVLFVDSIKEDGIVEVGTAVLALVSSVIFFIAGVLGSRFSFALCIAWLFFALEEISWGQRIFDVVPPELFLNYNYQRETNIHNFLNPIGTWIYVLFNLCLFCFFTYFRKVQGFSMLYRLNGMSDILIVSDKFGLWLIPLLLIFLSIYPGNEFVEEQWAIFGVLLSSLNLRQLNFSSKPFG